MLFSFFKILRKVLKLIYCDQGMIHNLSEPNQHNHSGLLRIGTKQRRAIVIFISLKPSSLKS